MKSPIPCWRAILGLALGNDLLIVIECLVIGIQATRLVLFGLFIRFRCKGIGRYHGPISSPPSSWLNSD